MLVLAGPGAIEASIRNLQGSCLNQELSSTFETDALRRPCSPPIRADNEQLIILDQVLGGPPNVAGATGGNQVAQIVIEAILVNVVNDQVSSSVVCLDLPGDPISAPVARMGSWPNGVKEHLAMFEKAAIFSNQGMIFLASQVAIASAAIIVVGSALKASSATPGAESAMSWILVPWLRSELLTTLNAVTDPSRHLSTVSEALKAQMPSLPIHEII